MKKENVAIAEEVLFVSKFPYEITGLWKRGKEGEREQKPSIFLRTVRSERSARNICPVFWLSSFEDMKKNHHENKSSEKGYKNGE